MATIREVARASGVSIATVSRVYGGNPHVSAETERRVREAAASLDFWPNSAARSLITNRTHALGILLPDLYGDFFSEIIRGIDRAARKEKLQILLSSSHADLEELVTAAKSMRGRIDGLIAMAPDPRSLTAIRQITRSVRVLLLNPWTDLPGCDSISIANLDGAQTLVRHLIRHGHRNIAIIRGPKENVDAEERLRGYVAALEEAGIEPSSRLILEGDFSEASGYRSAARLLRLHPRPTAVFAGNDYMAIGLLSGLRDAGVVVPHDIAVAGFDDIVISQYVCPPLTTVRVQAFDLGEKAVERWVKGIGSNGRSNQHEVLPTSLVIRASCGVDAASTDPLARCRLLSNPQISERMAFLSAASESEAPDVGRPGSVEAGDPRGKIDPPTELGARAAKSGKQGVPKTATRARKKHAEGGQTQDGRRQQGRSQSGDSLHG